MTRLIKSWLFVVMLPVALALVLPAHARAGATTPPSTTLATPTGLTALAGDRQVTLAWQPTAGALTYSVYLSTTGYDNSFAPLAADLATPAFLHTGLTNGTTYYYRVRAFAPLGSSAASSKVSARPLPPPPAAAPANLSATAGNARVDLTWALVDAATGYRIYRTTTGVFDTTAIASVTAPPFTNWSLTNGTTYSYKVVAYNTGGEGPASGAVSAMPIAPPAAVTAVAGDRQVTLNWQASAGASTYTLYRSTSTDDNTLVPVGAGLTALTFLDTGLTNDTTYYYRLRAFAPTTTSGLSSRVSAKPVPPPPATAPTSLVATPGNGRVDLTWDLVSTATGYRIYRSTTSTFDAVAVSTATAPPFTSWSLTNGTPYYFKVAAYNTGGTGPPSGAVNAMPIAPPGGVTAAAGDQQVTVSWQASAGALTYRVFRSTSTDDNTLVQVATDLAALTFVDTGLTNGTTYYYRLRAIGGGSTSGYSSRVSARPVPPPPATAPGNLVAKEGNTSVSLTWDAVPGATAYRIFRTTAATFDSTSIAKVTTTSYKNTGLTNGTTYSFKVVGNNMGGEGPPSAVVSATPLPPPPAPTDLSAAAGNHAITLAWTLQPSATAYNVYRGQSPGKEAATPLAAGVAGSPFVDNSAENGPTYFYKVTAINNGGESPRSAEVSATAEGPKLVVDAATTAAFRLLRQATWGPRPGDVDHVKTIGAEAFIGEQFSAPISSYPDILFNLPVETAQEHFMSLALTGPDQLRQRVAWALHKILVVSAVEVDNAPAIVTYYRLLMNGAFGNFRALLHDITLNPAMGRYLNMLNNKSQQVTGVPPNENYPRELMQLFSLGIPKLNSNGTPMVDATGAPIPAYTETDVKELARILTGWTFGDGDPATIPRRARSENYRVPMEAVVPAPPAAPYHDSGAKTFLGEAFLPGQTAAADVEHALDVIFHHPNVGPFISRQLIQELVTSNPSPGYVAAVAAVFNDNGAGMRGDLAAVVRAILLHPEASLTTPTSGKLAEPVLFVIAPLRALAANVADHPFMSDKAEAMGQKVFYPPSVFSYFSPGYRVRGTGPPPLLGPEFQALTSVTILERANFIGALLGLQYSSSVTVDYSPFTSIAGDAAALVDYCNLVFMGGRMSDQERREIINAVRASSLTSMTERMRTAIYLTLVIAQSQVDR